VARLGFARGRHKANSVASRIQLVNAALVCEVRRYRHGGQESSGAIEGLMESFGMCDVIIDATAEASVINYFCAAVEVFKKPMVWAEVFGGGFGGMIARHWPSIEPGPASMRLAIENWCAEKGKPMPKPAQRYGGEPHSPAIADDADVTVIAVHNRTNSSRVRSRSFLIRCIWWACPKGGSLMSHSRRIR